MEYKKVMELGLVKGEYSLPISNYVIEMSEITVFTKENLSPLIKCGLKKNNIEEYSYIIDEFNPWWEDKNGQEIERKDIPLIRLYITGLTIITLVSVEILNLWGYDVEIMGFNANSQKYYSQGIFEKNN